MPRISVLAAVTFGLLLSPAAAKAQDATSYGKPIDPQFKADILRLIELTHAVEAARKGARASAEWVRPRLVAVLPATSNREKIASDYIERVEAIPQSEEFVDGLVAIYAKYFSDEDVKALAQFYTTPAGQHFTKHAADVSMASMKLGQEVVAEKLGGVFAAVCSDHPELQGQVKFCGSRSLEDAAQDPK
jgi:hypothetical protein